MELADAVKEEGFGKILLEIQRDFPEEEYGLHLLYNKFSGFRKSDLTVHEILNALIKAAVELTTSEAPKWEYIAARFLNYQFGLELAQELKKRGIGSFYDKLRYLTDKELYGAYILERYSRQEIEQAEAFLDPQRDQAVYLRGAGSSAQAVRDPQPPWRAPGDASGNVSGHRPASGHGGKGEPHGLGKAVL